MIRNSVTSACNDHVTKDCHDRDILLLDNFWKPTWFRHICSLPTDDLKLAVTKRIAEDPSRWKEKEVASECSRLKKRYGVLCKIEDLTDSDFDPEVLSRLMN